MLTLRGSLYGPNLATTETEEEWDDEVQVLTADGRRVEDPYQLSLAELFARQDSVTGYLGRNLVGLAREEVGQLREELVSSFSLGEEPEFGLAQRRRLWEQINERFQARLFGTADRALAGTDYRNDADVPVDDPRKWSSGYPTTSGGQPDDEAALQAVDSVLEALESPRALQASVKHGGGGVFIREGGVPIRPAGPWEVDNIWNRAEARIELWLGSTDYTRFGAWRKQTAANAYSEYNDRFENNENGPNSFAYSQLPQTPYATDFSPRGTSATYQGEAVAVQQTTFYTGTVEIVAQWHSEMQTEDQAGTLTAAISNLQTQYGIPLQYTELVAGEERRLDVAEIVFGGLDARVDGESRLYFEEDQPRVVTIKFPRPEYEALGLETDPRVTASVEGKFLGSSSSGPQGVIGIWSLRDGGDSRLGVGDWLYGAFGAELRP